MMPNRGASLWVREKVGGAAISTSHFVKLGSALMRTCTPTGRVTPLPCPLLAAPPQQSMHSNNPLVPPQNKSAAMQLCRSCHNGLGHRAGGRNVHPQGFSGVVASSR